jgi:hypothetical protein
MTDAVGEYLRGAHQRDVEQQHAGIVIVFFWYRFIILL